MVIGISGKIGSGKDIIGNIIRYLSARQFALDQGIAESKIYSYTTYDPKAIDRYSKWEIKKFAGKLKQIVSILTGIPVNDLEKQEVKDLILPKEWQEYQITNWGKTAGLLNNLRFKTEEEVQEFCTNASNSQHDYRYIPSQRTVRWLLQTLGTQALRDVIHANVHINALFTDYKNTNTIPYAKEVGDEVFPNWIITDMRFPNELQAVKNRGGITIRVNRNWKSRLSGEALESRAYLMTHANLRNDPNFTAGEHPSETALDRASFDYVIENNGTIEELVEKVKQILTELKII